MVRWDEKDQKVSKWGCVLHTMQEMQVVVTRKYHLGLLWSLLWFRGWYRKKNHDQTAKLGPSSPLLMNLTLVTSLWCSWLLSTCHGASGASDTSKKLLLKKPWQHLVLIHAQNTSSLSIVKKFVVSLLSVLLLQN